MRAIQALPLLFLAACATDPTPADIWSRHPEWRPLCQDDEVSEDGKCRKMTAAEMKQQACILAVFIGTDEQIRMACED